MPELPIEIIVDGFGNSCFVEDALLSCEDLALLLVFDDGVPGSVGEALPESLFGIETIGKATIIASSCSSSSKKPSESLQPFSISSILLPRCAFSSFLLLKDEGEWFGESTLFFLAASYNKDSYCEMHEKYRER